MRDRCPVCGMRLARGEEGFSQWPSPPWDLLWYRGAVVMVVIPVLFYPVSKTLFLAFDLTFRPPSPEDFE
jgi:hypothetical protein